MKPIRDIGFKGLRPLPTAFEASESPAAAPVVPLDPAACPKCGGAGWVRLDVPVSHPSFGRPLRCDCLLERQSREQARESRRLSQLDGLEDRTFDSFDETVPGIEAAYAAARSYADNPDGWLILSGRCGCGKTHLAVAIANEWQANSTQPVMFTVVPDLLDHLRATFDPSKGVDYDERFNLFRNAFLLVLDDLGTENTTPWAKEKLFQIINHRYNERLPTVITTNRPFSEIDERVVSRMLDRSLSRSIVIDRAEDFRQRGQPGYIRGRVYRPYR